jgi:hypothetical protein
MERKIDLSPESICGTVIDTQETIIAGKKPNDAQVRACQLANASEALLSALSGLMKALDPQKPGSQASKKAADLLETLPPPLKG